MTCTRVKSLSKKLRWYRASCALVATFFIGIEKNENYFNIAKDRIENALKEDCCLNVEEKTESCKNGVKRKLF